MRLTFIIIIVLGMDAWTGNCVHVEKLNFLFSPYYAYMHQMDSTTDGALGEPVKFQYTDDGKLDSVNGRAISVLGPNNYEYLGNYGEKILVWDYESGGVDSMYLIGTPTDTSIKVYMRYSENYDVFETRRSTDGYQTIWNYDSVAYINGDSAFEYRRIKQFDQYYEYTKKCWAVQNRCDCELIDSTDRYPKNISRDPLYVWFDGKVGQWQGHDIVYKSSSSMASSSSHVPTAVQVLMQGVNAKKRSGFIWDLLGRMR